MNDDFTASNGGIVRSDGHPFVMFNANGMVTHTFSASEAQALREFFQAEADERLGRWRWPENPDYVVQPFAGGSGWNALCESTCVSGTFLSRDAVINSPSYLVPAVLAYIDDHPEPKPWHDAAAGEVWLLTINREADVPSVASASEGGHVVFTAATVGAGGTEEIAPESKYITAGRRIFPEVS